MGLSKDGPLGSLSKVGTLTQMWGNPSGSCGEVQRQTPELQLTLWVSRSPIQPLPVQEVPYGSCRLLPVQGPAFRVKVLFAF